MKKKGTKGSAGPVSRKKEHRERAISEKDLARLEVHRHALALLPDPADRRPGVAFIIEKTPHSTAWRFCSCSISKKRTCPHLLELAGLYRLLAKGVNGNNFEEEFRSSIWYLLAQILAEGSSVKARAVQVQSVRQNAEASLRVVDAGGEEMLSYFSQGPDSSRFVERCGALPDEESVPQRSAILEKLAVLTLTENERAMLDRGFQTRRQVLEESFWYRVAYHGYREFGARGCTFHPAIEEGSGSFTVTCQGASNESLFRVVVPRQKVRRLLTAFQERLPNQNNLTIHPLPLKSIFKVTMNTEMDLEVRPLIQLIQENGEERFFEREDFERFRYGDLMYVKELGIMVELERPGKERRFRAPVKMVLKKSQIPAFLEDVGEGLGEGPHIMDPKVKALRIFKQSDRVEISPQAVHRDWCWLSVKYGFGSSWISLNEILHAKKEGQRYIATPEGWVDCQSPDLEGITRPAIGNGLDSQKDQMKFSRMDILRLKSSAKSPLTITGKDKKAALLQKILDVRPSGPLPELKGMTSTLRAYQRIGVEWIMFLHENRLGGILCDDMGLGKTHQIMAFMVFLKEHRRVKRPSLVVCPTTVLSHWDNKIRQHAPALKTAFYYGGQRDLQSLIKGHHVLLTSYGVLRRDIEELRQVRFSLAVFDEIQQIKNSQTLGYQAAKQIDAAMRIGLTGTPIENALLELKALMDQTVPGYLGTDEHFLRRYVQSDPSGAGGVLSPRKEELSRLIAPFTLRRLKKTVLRELPEKIEDIRTCSLSEDQVRLYRDAIASRGRGLLDVLSKGEEPVPYIHIFALLNLLKQICDHPALLEGRVEDHGRYESGKWELFKELLAESLDSGQKVVVYSQYLGMIKIIEGYLRKQSAGFVTLTGASRKRGDIVSRFNDDPGCRVYVGSLKAGGMGIDLVAASVVIHYDRWWNAAKEDQATDRVHRIGQRRGVQVFKLVTEGTLEEKISAIIAKKRNLMESVIREDDPGLLKTFSREELMEMLSEPPG